MYRQYDTAVLEFCKVKLGGKDVPLVGPLPPQRAWATVQDILSANNAKDERERKDNTFIPLPIISIIRFPEMQSFERYRRADVTRGLKYNDNYDACTTGVSPLPYDLPYQVDIWAYFADDAFAIKEGFLRKWRNYVKAIPVDHGPPLGVFNVYARLTDTADNSELESEEGDRVLRYTLSFTVEGFLAFPAVMTPTVRQTDIYAKFSDPATNSDTSDEELIHRHRE